MVKHKQVYLDYFGYGIDDFVPCEACGSEAVDIHHIENRDGNNDVIDNLIALCRKHHAMAHSSKTYVAKDDFKYIHNSFLAGQRKQFLK